MLPLSLYNYFRLFENHLTLFKDSRVFLSGLLSLMGTSDMNSTPPAITVSHWPLAISPTAFRIKKRKKEIALWETQPLKKLWRSIATINYFATKDKTHSFPWNKNNATLKHKPIFSDVELNSKQIEVDSTLKLIRSTRKNTCQTHLTPNSLKKIVIFQVSMNLKRVRWAYFFLICLTV